MANDGIKIILTLKELISGSNIPTGNTKVNSIGDPDYIPPYEDLAACPVSYSFSCPVMMATMHDTVSVSYEFSLSNAIIDYPGLDKITVENQILAGSVQQTIDYISGSLTNYYSGSFDIFALPFNVSYSLNIVYYSGATELHRCDNEYLYYNG